MAEGGQLGNRVRSVTDRLAEPQEPDGAAAEEQRASPQTERGNGVDPAEDGEPLAVQRAPDRVDVVGVRLNDDRAQVDRRAEIVGERGGWPLEDDREGHVPRRALLAYPPVGDEHGVAPDVQRRHRASPGQQIAWRTAFSSSA